MAPPPTKKQRVEESQTNGTASPVQESTYSSDALEPATAEEKRIWQGFCEIESEPAFFNVMLKDFGVKGVKVQEVFSLDEVLLAMLPKPIYGLIFLFRYKVDHINNQEATCPDKVWFANQTGDFSCATVALLNIVFNIHGVQLGEHLKAFKHYSRDFTPALRGDAIENFAFVKEIHNSFARKRDMLNIDLGLQNNFDDRRKPKVAPKPKKATKKSSKNQQTSITVEDDHDPNAAFHFSAYVPVDGEVWKLDGLDRQPERVASFADDQDWLSVITPVIEDRMTTYEEGQIEFGLLSLVKDPVETHREDLARNIKSIQSIEEQLSAAGADDIVPAKGNDEKPTPMGSFGADAVFGITDDMIKDAEVFSDAVKTDQESISEVEVARLVALRQFLINCHRRLRTEMLEEFDAEFSDEQVARDRRQDYAPVIHAWLQMLAQKDGLLKELIEDIESP